MSNLEIDLIAKKEAPATESIGVVLVVLAGGTLGSDDLMVSTVLELQSKQGTEREAGQISLPAETRKVGEKEMHNVLGAVAELTNSDAVLASLRVDPERFYARAPILVRGKPVDIALMIYDGPIDHPLAPVDDTEVQNNGWMRMGDVQKMNGEVRRVAHDSLDFIRDHALPEIPQDYLDKTIPLTQLLEPGFSLRDFIDQREQGSDVDLA